MNKLFFFVILFNIVLLGQTYKMNINLENGLKTESPIDDIRNLSFDSSTGIKQIKQFKDVVQTIKVFQNYPNPFNPTTKIPFKIFKPCSVKVVVFDVNGLKVKELLNEFLLDGDYDVKWNGTNSFNENIASGIYFYAVFCDELLASGKMVLIR